MEKIKIEEYNKAVLENVNEHLNFSEWKDEPIIKEIRFEDFEDYHHKLDVLLSAIERLGYDSSDKEVPFICAGLAGIAKKMIPTDELNFLDKLLFKKTDFSKDKIELRKINDIK